MCSSRMRKSHMLLDLETDLAHARPCGGGGLGAARRVPSFAGAGAAPAIGAIGPSSARSPQPPPGALVAAGGLGTGGGGASPRNSRTSAITEKLLAPAPSTPASARRSHAPSARESERYGAACAASAARGLHGRGSVFSACGAALRWSRMRAAAAAGLGLGASRCRGLQ